MKYTIRAVELLDAGTVLRATVDIGGIQRSETSHTFAKPKDLERGKWVHCTLLLFLFV